MSAEKPTYNSILNHLFKLHFIFCQATTSNSCIYLRFLFFFLQFLLWIIFESWTLWRYFCTKNAVKISQNPFVIFSLEIHSTSTAFSSQISMGLWVLRTHRWCKHTMSLSSKKLCGWKWHPPGCHDPSGRSAWITTRVFRTQKNAFVVDHFRNRDSQLIQLMNEYNKHEWMNNW